MSIGCSGSQNGGATTTSPQASERPAPGIDIEVGRLFTHPLPEGELPSGFDFSPDGKRLAYYRTISKGSVFARQLWLHDLESGSSRRMPATSTGGIDAFDWFPDGQSMLARAGTLLQVVPVAEGEAARQLTTKSVRGPRLSPDAKQVGFVRGHNLWVVDVADGQERQLTTDGSEVRLNGEVDWVYEEELELYEAFWWAPDSRRIAFLQFDESAVTEYPVVYPGAAGATPEVVRQRYPQAGETNPTVRLGIIALDGPADATPEPSWLQLDTPAGEETYIARVGWTPDGGHIYVITLDRLQRVLRLTLLDPTGATPQRTIIEERDEQWLNLLDKPRFLAEGRQLLWRSERDGHAHLYVYELGGSEPRQITSGAWQVSTVLEVDEEAGTVYFVGNREAPALYQLYSVPLAGGEEPRRISQEQGCHSVTFSPDAGHYVDVHSSVNRPPRAQLHRSDGTMVSVLAAEDLVEVADLASVEAEIFEIPGPQDIRYQARMFRPTDMEEGRRYPVLVWVYNGPGAQIVRDQWRSKYVPWMRLLARRGVLVFSMDGRGTTGRGRAWEKPIYGRLGEVELADQMRGIEYLRDLPYVDGDRIGVFGWSYGGTMVLAALLRQPGTFRVGVCVAPVSDWRFYDTIYTERYMMRPQDNPTGYTETALWPLAGRLEDPLLLIHGLSDDNVHFRNSERMVSALVDHGRRFDLMVYPGQSHGIGAPPSRRHVFSTITSYVLEHLLDR